MSLYHIVTCIDTYFHVSIVPLHKPFLQFAFEGQAYQYMVLLCGLSLSPRIFTNIAEVAHAPLREVSICILNYLSINPARLCPSLLGYLCSLAGPTESHF